MIKKLARSVLGKFMSKRKAAKAAADLDRLAVKELDRRTYGAASRVDEVL